MSPGPERLVLVGRYVNEVQGRYYAKAANCDYFRELAREFSRLVLCTRVYRPGDPGYAEQETPLPDEVEVRPLHSMPGPRGVAERVGGLLREGRWFRRNLNDGRTMTLAFVPNSYVPLVFRFTPPFPGVVYMGSDWSHKAPYTGGGAVSTALRRRYYVWGQRAILSRAHGVITADRGLQLILEDTLGKPVLRTEPITLLRPEHLEARGSYELHRPARLLYVGTFHAGKGLKFLAEAFHRLRESHDVELRLAGTGVEEGALRRALEPAGEAVRFLGYVSDFGELRDVYRQADLLVYPSLHEGFPRVLFEAMAHGLPVVATSVGSVPRVLEHNRDALLVPPADAGGLADAVEELLEDGERRARLGRAGLETARRNLGRTAAEQHAEFLRAVWRSCREAA